MARYLRLRPANVQTITLTARGRFWGGVTAPPPPAAPSNSVAPFLSGALFTGETLTANRGVWSGVPAPTFQYEFRRQAGGTVLQAFSSSNTYVVASTEVGQNILVAVRATNSEGTVTVTSAAIGPFAAPLVAPSFSAAPVIAIQDPNQRSINPSDSSGGTPDTLIVSSTGLAAGVTATLAYQWRRNGVPIAGATNSTYLVSPTDFGASITLVVTATNALGSVSSAASNALGPVAGLPINTAAPVLVEPTALEPGQEFGSTSGTWTSIPGSPTFEYRWLRNGVQVQAWSSAPGADSYTVVNLDMGTTLTSQVRASNGEGTSAPVSSNGVTLPAPSGIAPENIVLPAISGLPWVGQALTTTSGTWTGTPDPTLSYQWRRGGVAVPGATTTTYLLSYADLGANIDVVVTATNGIAPDASATSVAVGPVVVPDVIQEFQATRGWDFSQVTGTFTRSIPEINGGPVLEELDGFTSLTDQSTGILSPSGIGPSRVNRAVRTEGLTPSYHWQTLESTQLDVPAGSNIWYRTIYIDAPSSPGGTIGIVEHRNGLNINRFRLNNGFDSGSVFYTAFEGSGSPGPGFYQPFTTPIDGVPMLVDTYINGTTGTVTHSVNGQHVSSSSSAFTTLPARSIINPFFGSGQDMSGSLLFVGYRLGASADAFSTTRHDSDAIRLGLLSPTLIEARGPWRNAWDFSSAAGAEVPAFAGGTALPRTSGSWTLNQSTGSLGLRAVGPSRQGRAVVGSSAQYAAAGIPGFSNTESFHMRFIVNLSPGANNKNLIGIFGDLPIGFVDFAYNNTNCLFRYLVNGASSGLNVQPVAAQLTVPTGWALVDLTIAPDGGGGTEGRIMINGAGFSSTAPSVPYIGIGSNFFQLFQNNGTQYHDTGVLFAGMRVGTLSQAQHNADFAASGIV